LNIVDGATLKGPHEQTADAVVVGSGPAGATVARELALAGLEVAVVEEGPFVRPEDCPEDGFSAMAQLYRDMGASIMLGSPPMPFVQGRLVGGTSVVNGAISWRLPKDVYAEWLRADRALAETLDWAELERIFDEIEAELSIQPTEEAVAGPNNALLARGAAALGLAHRPIWRNVRSCRGLGRCLQGCPEGRKTSMDRSYLPEACEHGARILASTRIEHIETRAKRARAVTGTAASGAAVRLRARHAVVLAASAVQTPVLLWRSGIRHGPVGEHFQCHPGVSMAGRFAKPVRLWTGATQGHEVTGLRHEGLKFEALGYDMALVGMRLGGVGQRFSEALTSMAHWCLWGAAIRARAEGRVRPSRRGASVRFALTPQDVTKVRRGVRVLGELLLAAGAEYVSPGVYGWHERVVDRAVMARFEQDGPRDPKAYTMAATHLFGTCRMGSDPTQSVVRPDFRHHALRGLYLADSSVFPSNIGVNPQTSIIALAKLCARSIAR